jgi:hypothetical protein
MYEKKKLLDDAYIVVTMLGSNCFNFIFSEHIPNFIILTNIESSFYSDYYPNLLRDLNKVSVNWNLLQYPSNTSKTDPKNRTNSPFTVDVNYIINLANSL